MITFISMILLSISTPQDLSNEKDVIETLKECSIINNDVARLGCYDAVIKNASGTTILNRQESNFSAHKRSGLKINKPSRPEENFEGGAVPGQENKPRNPEDILKEIIRENITNKKNQFEVISFSRKQNGRYIFNLSDGSTWEQTDSFTRPLRNERFKVTLKKGSFGSFIMKPVKGGWSVRVKQKG